LDVFLNIGLCDITAHVDFSALAQAASQLDLQLAGFTSQGAYLLANNLGIFAEQLINQTIDQTIDQNRTNDSNIYRISQQVQQLTSPHEMGELFKVMALTKNWDQELSGFQFYDHRYRL